MRSSISCTRSRVRRTKKACGSTPGASADAVAVVEDDEIDVARIVELAGAVLAHGEHDVADRRDAAVASCASHWPRAAASRNRKPTAPSSAASAHSVSAAVTVSTGHTPARSASAVSSATSVLNTRRARMASARVCAACSSAASSALAAPRAALPARCVRDALQARGIALDEAGQIRRAAEDAGQQLGDARIGRGAAASGGERRIGARPLAQGGQRASGPRIVARGAAPR